MKLSNIYSGALAVALCMAGAPLALGEDTWHYKGNLGPAHWATLHPEYAACAGHNQSPVNVHKAVQTGLPPIEFAYTPGKQHGAYNTGHSIQVDYDDSSGSAIRVDDTRFRLVQFHFHTPGEHLIDGKSWPMEAHLVHADEDGNLAVVGVMLEEGADNPALAAILQNNLHDEGARHGVELNAADLLPGEKSYYRYSGSLTTPPCSEGVRWLVMTHPVPAGKDQIRALADLAGMANNRPVQPVNARLIMRNR